jgi:hypothetical protein
MITGTARDQDLGHARQLAAQQQAADTKIAQKVNAAHREAFREKFPGQCEHIMRLIAERLQQGLRKDQAVELSAGEICYLARALDAIYSIHIDLQD